MFLKNVNRLSPAEQEQLLLALEEVADLEGNGGPPVGVRILSSATESLEPIVSRGRRNPALYHRLSVYRICLPPLRDRREDIPELFGQMVRRAANGNGAPPAPPSRLLDALMEYDWPGNLRELQNIARTYAVMAQADEIIAELRTAHGHTPERCRPSAAGSAFAEGAGKRGLAEARIGNHTANAGASPLEPPPRRRKPSNQLPFAAVQNEELQPADSKRSPLRGKGEINMQMNHGRRGARSAAAGQVGKLAAVVFLAVARLGAQSHPADRCQLTVGNSRDGFQLYSISGYAGWESTVNPQGRILPAINGLGGIERG